MWQFKKFFTELPEFSVEEKEAQSYGFITLLHGTKYQVCNYKRKTLYHSTKLHQIQTNWTQN